MTFSSFRRRFPEVSGYCYCSDSQGRELAETGNQPHFWQWEGIDCNSWTLVHKAEVALAFPILGRLLWVRKRTQPEPASICSTLQKLLLARMGAIAGSKRCPPRWWQVQSRLSASFPSYTPLRCQTPAQPHTAVLTL